MKISFMENPPIYDLHDTDSLAACFAARFSYITPQDTVIVNEAAITFICLYGDGAEYGIKGIGFATCMQGDGEVYVVEFLDASALWIVVGNDSYAKLCGVHTTDSVKNPPGTSIVNLDVSHNPRTVKDDWGANLKTLETLFLGSAKQPDAIRMDVAIKIIETQGNPPGYVTEHFIN